jgi:peptidyl-prolyl cis-trans isomerase SurA
MFRPLLSAALACLATGVAHPQTRELSTAGDSIDRVAAVVNDGIVLKSEVDEQVALVTLRLQQQNLEMPPENVLQQQVLERLVLQEIQMQRASRGGLKVTDEMVNSALQDVAKRNGLTLTQLPEALASQGIDYANYRDNLRKEITLQMLQQRDVIARINISPRELDRYLEKQGSRPNDDAAYDISHILVSVPQAGTPEQMAAAEQRAEDVHRRALGGEDFATLAVEYSNATTALEGGALGWRKAAELPTVLADSVIALKPGEVSDIIRTPSGYHLVKLNEVRDTGGPSIVQQVHARHILVKTNEVQDDATVEQRLASARERIVNGEDFAGIAKTMSEDPGSAAEGGDLGWTPPDTFVPEFEAQLNALKIDEISQPFRTQYGWHIVQVLGRRDFDNTEEMKRQRAFAQLREGKAEEETELWLRRLRDEAYVEYKL